MPTRLRFYRSGVLTAGVGPPAAAPPALAVPAAPSSLVATGSTASSVTLTWAASASGGAAAATVVERSPDGIGSWAVLTSGLSGSAAAYTDTGLAAGTAYYYRVKATNASGSSPYSGVAPGTTASALAAPGVPSAVSATPVGSSAASVTLTPPGSGGAVASYDYQFGTDAVFTAGVVAGNSLTSSVPFTGGGLAASTTYRLRVAARNAAGVSAWATAAGTVTTGSAVVTGTLATPTLGVGVAKFGQVYPRGAVPAGTSLRIGSLPTQTKVLRHWDDGSVKHTRLVATVPTAGAYAVAAGSAATGSFAMPTVTALAAKFVLQIPYVLLGTATISGTSVDVVLGNASTSGEAAGPLNVVADTVRLERVSDNAVFTLSWTGTGYSETGSGWNTNGTIGVAGPVRINHVFTAENATAVFHVTGLTAGAYRVYVTHPAYPSWSTQAPWKVKEGATTLLGPVTVNQQVAPVTASPAAGSFTAAMPTTVGALLDDGPLFKLWQHYVTPTNDAGGAAHPTLRVIYEVSAYSGVGYEVDVTVTNHLQSALGRGVPLTPSLVAGATTLWSHAVVTVPWLAGFRIPTQAVGPVTRASVADDTASVTAAGLVPKYLAGVTDFVDDVSGQPNDILQRGEIPAGMGDAGEYSEREGMPNWRQARHIVHRRAAQKAVVLADAERAAAWPMCLDMTDAVDPVNVATNPTFFWNSTATNGLLGSTSGQQLGPEANHTPSLCYYPYLITADPYYARVIAYHAAWGQAVTGPLDGSGPRYFLPRLIEVRGLARQVGLSSQAAAILPDGHPLITTSADIVKTNLAWADAEVATHSGPFGIILGHGNGLEIAPMFQYGYLNWWMELAYSSGVPGLTTEGRTAQARLAAFALQWFNRPDTEFNRRYASGGYWQSGGTGYLHVVQDSVSGRPPLSAATTPGAATSSDFAAAYAYNVTRGGPGVFDEEPFNYGPEVLGLLKVAERLGLAGAAAAYAYLKAAKTNPGDAVSGVDYYNAARAGYAVDLS